MAVDLAGKAGQVCKEAQRFLEETRIERALSSDKVPGHAEDAFGQMAFCLVLLFLIIFPPMRVCRRWSQEVLIVL